MIPRCVVQIVVVLATVQLGACDQGMRHSKIVMEATHKVDADASATQQQLSANSAEATVTTTKDTSTTDDSFTPPAQNASAAAFAQIFVDHPDALDAMQELESMDTVRNEPGISWEEFQQQQQQENKTAPTEHATANGD